MDVRYGAIRLRYQCGPGPGQRGRRAAADARLETVVPDGVSFCFGPEQIHRLIGATDRSVSIHAYSPPLWQLGQYSIHDGVLRRLSVSCADELRPLDDAA